MAMSPEKMYGPSSGRNIRRRARWAVVAVAAVLIASCGNSSNEESATSDRRGKAVQSSSEVVASDSELNSDEVDNNTSANRPEGTWSMLTWHKDNGTETTIGGQLYERMWKFTPTCESGPCDIEVSAGGASGTYTPEGEFLFDSDDPLANAGFLLTWDDTAKEYVLSDEGTNSCVFDDGTSIEDGFTRSTVSRLKFTPANSDSPAMLTGHRTESYEATTEAATAGCAQSDVEYTVSGTPAGSFTNPTFNIAGEYQTTGVVSTNDGNEHASWAGADPGFSNRFGRWVIAGSGEDLTLTGIEQLTMDLSDQAPWSGSITSEPADCTDLQTGEYYGQWTITESVSEMQVIGLTASGEPILVTMWELLIPIAPEEASFDCGVDDVTARVHLLPVAAIEQY